MYKDLKSLVLRLSRPQAYLKGGHSVLCNLIQCGFLYLGFLVHIMKTVDVSFIKLPYNV